jgi:putative transposase
MRFVKKIKISLNKTQTETINFWLRRCKTLYNGALEHRSEVYRKTGKAITYFEQKKELPLLKLEDKSWGDIPNKSLTETLKRVDTTFKNFFRGGGYPKYKNQDNFKSIYFVKEDVRLKQNKLYLPKIKTPISITENVIEGYTSITLKEEGGKYYLIFNYDNNKLVVKDKETDLLLNSVGADLGLKKLLTDSDGFEVKRFSTKLIKRYTDRISELNKSLSKCKKGSKNRKKVKKQLTCTHLRLKNSRLDFQKKEANKYVNYLLGENKEVLVIGDIQVSKIVNKSEDKKVKSKRYLRRSFSNNSLGQFKLLLGNKAESKGLKVYFVNESYTSKACSCCGEVNDNLKLSDRIFKCNNCGEIIDRDRNGAINIKHVWQGQFNPYRLDSQGEQVPCVIKK